MDKCWRCGSEIPDKETEVCPDCGADQRRAEPRTVPGQALRKLYDRFGAEAVLTNPSLLANGFADLISDPLAVNIKKLKNQIRIAINIGVGEMYRTRLAVGQPDSVFGTQVIESLIAAGLNEADAGNLKVYFDEMIGWSAGRISNDIPDIGNSMPAVPSDCDPTGDLNPQTPCSDPLLTQAVDPAGSTDHDSGVTQIDPDSAKRDVPDSTSASNFLYTQVAVPAGFSDHDSGVTQIDPDSAKRALPDSTSALNYPHTQAADPVGKTSPYDIPTQIDPDSPKQDIYEKAKNLMQAETLAAYREALNLLELIPGYSDADELAAECRREIQNLSQGGDPKRPERWPLIAAALLIILLPILYSVFGSTVLPAKPTATPTARRVLPEKEGGIHPTNTPVFIRSAATSTNTPVPPMPVILPTNTPVPIQPTHRPTQTDTPTKTPTRIPTKTPTRTPTRIPTNTPTRIPTKTPTRIPTRTPTPRTDLSVLFRQGEDSFRRGRYEEALSYLQPAADGGYPAAQNMLGYMYQNGLGGLTKSAQMAVSYYQKAANQGYDQAQFNLGYMYQYGLGVNFSYENARYWYAKAANSGITKANVRLGELYYEGWGVSKNVSTARSYFLTAANLDDPEAQRRLGITYEAAGDLTTAKTWYDKAEKNGDGYVLVLLGNWYLYGRGSVPKNTGTACNYYLRAANKGVPDGMLNYAYNGCVSGSEQTRYYQKALSGYKTQADAGIPEAMYWLGKFYENGWGTARSTSSARYYYQMARDRGLTIAGEALRNLN